MQVAVLDKKVRQNLSLFKHLVHREAEKRARYFQVAKKSFRAFINRETGEFRFQDLQGKEFSEKNWKAVVIQLRPEDDGAFEVLEEGSEGCFHCEELAAEAYAVLTKTLHILNQLSYDPKKGKNPFWVLRHVSQLDFVMTEQEEGRRNLIHEAWHNIDREYAEYLLSGMPIGSYLFRKDEFAHLLEQNLNEEISTPVSCITLTYSDWDEKICEKTLVFHENKWRFYDDDPGLYGASFENVQDLLATLGDSLRAPLFAE